VFPDHSSMWPGTGQPGKAERTVGELRPGVTEVTPTPPDTPDCGVVTGLGDGWTTTGSSWRIQACARHSGEVDPPHRLPAARALMRSYSADRLRGGVRTPCVAEISVWSSLCIGELVIGKRHQLARLPAPFRRGPGMKGGVGVQLALLDAHGRSS